MYKEILPSGGFQAGGGATDAKMVFDFCCECYFTIY